MISGPRTGSSICEIDSLLPERPEFEFLRASSFKPAQVDATGAVSLPAVTLRVFTVLNHANGWLLDHADILKLLADLGLESVAQLGPIKLDHSVDELVAFAEGTSLLNPKIQREGVVLRPLSETYDEDLGGRLSFMVINPKFLLKYDE